MGTLVFGIVELTLAWPWQRGVGFVALALGLVDHARGADRRFML
jgi:hypothetical protein